MTDLYRYQNRSSGKLPREHLDWRWHLVTALGIGLLAVAVVLIHDGYEERRNALLEESKAPRTSVAGVGENQPPAARRPNRRDDKLAPRVGASTNVID